MALPGQAGRNYRSMMSGAKRGAFARSPSAAKRGVFAQSPSAAKRGIFAFSPGAMSGQSSPANVSNELSPAAQYGRMINQGQAGGMKSISPGARAMSYTDPVERVRAELFDNRQDVSRDRLQRRLNQRQGNLLDKLTMFKPVSGSSNLLQSTVPGGPTIAETQAERARQFGPTFKEIMSDINYGAGQIGKGLAEKGTPLMNLLKSIYGGVQNFFTPNQGPVPTDQFASFKQGMNNAQLGLFNYYINRGNSPEYARNAALSGVVPQMAMGGVASL